MIAWRLALKRGEWDVDALLDSIPISMWDELVIAHTMIEHYDDWLRVGDRAKPYKRPSFVPKPKPVRWVSGKTH